MNQRPVWTFINCLIILGAAFLAILGPSAVADPPGSTSNWLDDHLPALVEFYQQLHQEPELSFEEKETAARMAGELRQLGFGVT